MRHCNKSQINPSKALNNSCHITSTLKVTLLQYLPISLVLIVLSQMISILYSLSLLAFKLRY